jgi:hypothetical protein
LQCNPSISRDRDVYSRIFPQRSREFLADGLVVVYNKATLRVPKRQRGRGARRAGPRFPYTELG